MVRREHGQPVRHKTSVQRRMREDKSIGYLVAPRWRRLRTAIAVLEVAGLRGLHPLHLPTPRGIATSQKLKARQVCCTRS